MRRTGRGAGGGAGAGVDGRPGAGGRGRLGADERRSAGAARRSAAGVDRGRLLLLGGSRVDEQQPPCPPAASCAGVEPTRFDDGAAWDPATGRWSHLVDPTGADSHLSQDGDGAVWSGTSVFTRGQRTTPDLALGTTSTADGWVWRGLGAAPPRS
ncbi:hypothetical protein FHN55_19155 [Streptomyces sp. NP160]|uniref:hypothetical protein n=1 Tax=Streptomyces sp. NP160 TaxID=2586637 RepID=UPI00111AAA8D|nr:hypothetical protein [Streptomyces sp. NP160]TNM59930.1 hypothetical protein FHN55_19155 [Streptomyces sp. NP160]